MQWISEMKRTKLLMVLLAGLLLFLMLGGFGSRASRPENRAASSPSPLPPSSIDPNDKGEATTKASNKEGAASTATQTSGDEDEDSDPDLGKFHGTIDHDKYLRMRD